MNLVKHAEMKMKVEFAPLIDVVFLLLIYFMVTASLIKKEADIGFMLPSVHGAPLDNFPLELVIEIKSNGGVEVEGMQFAADDAELADLAMQLVGLKEVARLQGSDFTVSLLPDNEARHQRVIDVMDACSRAGVELLSFSDSI